MLHKLVILVSLLFGLVTANAVSAQTVDPCQFGCPKEGCPQCDKGGGPIKSGSEDGEPDGDAEDGDSDDDDGGSDDDGSGDLPA